MFVRSMNKRGQFFLIFAAVMIMVLFTIVAQYNSIRIQVALEDFDELSDQYSEEQPKVINAAIYEGENPADEVLSFTEDYLQYARQREPTFGVLYTYRDDRGTVHLVNTLNDAVLNVEFTDPATGRD